MDRSQIENRAKEILQGHGLFLIPVDPVLLANKEGIKVHNATFSDDGISGMVAKRGANITMLVNQSDSPARKRFSIAHELGHHFLHLMDDGEMVTRKTDLFRGYAGEPIETVDPNKRKEVEANQFAAAILMPEDLVKREFDKTPDVVSLAVLFNVSEEAMGIRLSSLRLL
jgi:Zn-dependent peptidase ImmA (M78 family)